MLVDQQGRMCQQYTGLAVYSLLDIYNQQGTGFDCQPLKQNSSPRPQVYMLVDQQGRMCQRYTGLAVYSLLDIYNLRDI
jgi:hypothetical protein